MGASCIDTSPHPGDPGSITRWRVTTSPAHRFMLPGRSEVPEQREDPVLMTPRTYEIVVDGEIHPAIVEAFEDFDVRVESGSTILRAELPDQAALYGALDRLVPLDLVLVEVKIVEPAQQ
jgi:hypothetical protein